MKNIRVASLEQINLTEMTEIWNRCWRGYYYDMSYTPAQIKGWLDLSQVSLQHSTAIYVEDRIVGFALLSVDGKDSWIAGACIDPKYRRRGLFTALMRIELDVARRAGLKRVYLEVLEQNHALKVYESVGFVRMRLLNIYRRQNRIERPSKIVEIRQVESVSLETYFDKRRAQLNPAWQRRESYLRRHVNIFAVMNASGSAGALFAGNKTALLLDAWSATLAGAEEVILDIVLRSSNSWSLTNQPDDQMVAFLKSRGMNPSAKQVEMCIELA
jgi:ribosomal protein S18 acetylase RimI-like enzyme